MCASSQLAMGGGGGGAGESQRAGAPGAQPHSRRLQARRLLPPLSGGRYHGGARRRSPRAMVLDGGKGVDEEVEGEGDEADRHAYKNHHEPPAEPPGFFAQGGRG